MNMQSRARNKSVIPYPLLAAVIFLATLSCHPAANAEQSDSVSHLEIVTDFGANCVARSAKQLLIQNNHPDRSIKVKLFRYFGEVRQPGRSVYVLQPGEEPLALGCDKIQGRAQRWEITASEYSG